MTSRRTVDKPPTRRDRRATARADARSRTHQTGPFSRLARWAAASPVLVVSIAAIILAGTTIAAVTVLPNLGIGAPTASGARTASGIVVPPSATPASVMDGRSLGSTDAPVHLTVWSDFQCPACRAFARQIEPRLIGEDVVTGKLRIDYRDLTIIGAESRLAAVATRCADRQGRFWALHDVLFANQAAENSGALTTSRLGEMADAIDLDRGAFDACVADPATAAEVDAEVAQGRTKGASTPTLDFGTFQYAGSPPFEQLQARIDQLVAAAGR